MEHKCTAQAAARRPSGFTLIELLLALMLMAAVAAVAWPTVRRQFDNFRLRTAADMVRTEWCRARIEAMRTGSVYTFRHSLEGNRFCTQRGSNDVGALPAASPSPSPSPSASPAASPVAAQASPPQQPAGTGGPGGTSPPSTSAGAAQPPIGYPAEKMLPEGVEFLMQEAAPDPATADAEITAGTQDAAQPDWSDPIFFYPDGTTSDAQLTLKNGQGRGVELNLRGLTGTVDVGDIQALEE
ncbi:MAG: prepilin-type N-terminal cleavage/methylation domain-containing protein [Thermoguttaceae bacterium]